MTVVARHETITTSDWPMPRKENDMILDQDKKVTAKQKAQDIIAQKLHAAFYSDTWEESEMTQKEIDEIFRKYKLNIKAKEGYDYDFK